MYPFSDWSSSLLRTIMDISARAISLADRPRLGHSGHQCSLAPGRPILHLVSSSRRPRRVGSLGFTSSRAHWAAAGIFLASKFRPRAGMGRADQAKYLGAPWAQALARGGQEAAAI